MVGPWKLALRDLNHTGLLYPTSDLSDEGHWVASLQKLTICSGFASVIQGYQEFVGNIPIYARQWATLHSNVTAQWTGRVFFPILLYFCQDKTPTFFRQRNVHRPCKEICFTSKVIHISLPVKIEGPHLLRLENWLAAQMGNEVVARVDLELYLERSVAAQNATWRRLEGSREPMVQWSSSGYYINCEQLMVERGDLCFGW